MSYLRMRDRSNRCVCCGNNISEQRIVCRRCRVLGGDEMAKAIALWEQAKRDASMLTQWATNRARVDAINHLEAARAVIIGIGRVRLAGSAGEKP